MDTDSDALETSMDMDMDSASERDSFKERADVPSSPGKTREGGAKSKWSLAIKKLGAFRIGKFATGIDDM